MTSFNPLGTPYSADGSTPQDMRNGGHRLWLLPMLSDTLAALQAAYSALGLSSSPTAMATKPSGRLTLISQNPVLYANVVATGTVYYTPYDGNYLPIFNGSLWLSRAFSELSLVLDSNSGHAGYHANGSLFDLFVFDDAGTLRLGTGPAWTSSVARGTGAGTTQIAYLNGIYVNAVSTTMRFGSASGNTVVVAANRATYVGTVLITPAAGQTGMNFLPVATVGGPAPALALFNQYNRVPVIVESRDSTTSWTYNSVTWRQANASGGNRFYWVDGTAQCFVNADYRCIAVAGAGNVGANIALSLDSATISGLFSTIGQSSTLTGASIQASGSISPQLGLHCIQALEAMNSAVTGTFVATGVYQSIIGRLSM